MKKNGLTVAILAFSLIPACLEGGANTNGNQPGNKEGGINLWLGEIAVDGGGQYFLSRTEGYLVIGDLSSRSMSVIEDLPSPEMVAFWPGGGGIYLLSYESLSSPNPKEVLISYDLERGVTVWRRHLNRLDLRLDVAPTRDAITLSNEETVLILRTDTGNEIATITQENDIVDVDLTADRIIITERNTFDENRLPFTRVSSHAIEDGRMVCSVSVPNCHSELVVSRSGSRAFVAPTRCGRDPISVVDLEGDHCRFVQNLPGFGPVALSPDTEQIIGFLDRDANDPQAPPLPAEVMTSPDRYHLMFIDVTSLEFDTAPIGDHLPRYTFTPNGGTLLVDTAESERRGIAILDVESKQIRRVDDPRLELDEYVLTPDSDRAFLIDSGLFELDIEFASTQRLGLSYAPISINITPDGETLLMKSRSDGIVHLYEPNGHREVGTMVTMAP